LLNLKRFQKDSSNIVKSMTQVFCEYEYSSETDKPQSLTLAMAVATFEDNDVIAIL